MKHKAAVLSGLTLVVLIGVTVAVSHRKSQSSAAQQNKIHALQDLRDSGVITPAEYDAKVTSLKASTPVADSGHVDKVSWSSSTRKVEIEDPQYQMTAYTMDIPSDWKFAGAMVRPGGCHSNGAGLKYTLQSPDGKTSLVLLPGVTWAWNTGAQMQKIMEQSHCPGIDIDSAAKFLADIAIPNLHPNAKLLEMLPLRPEGQAAIAKQLEDAKANNAKMAAGFGMHPQDITIDGARAHVQYERDGQQVEEMIISVIQCTTTHQAAMFKQPAADQRTCNSRGTSIYRTPLGQLDAFMNMPQVQNLGKALQINHEWDMRVAQDMQASFNRFQAANNAQFQANLKANQAAFDQRIAQQKQFDANLRASTDRAMAQDRARQDAIDASAHKMALYANDQQDFRDPNTGRTIQASNQYNHQWISSDGSTLIQTNDHTYDPNGQVYPVSQSWSELVPK